MEPKAVDAGIKKNLMRTDTVEFEGCSEIVVTLGETEIVPVGLVTKRSSGLERAARAGAATRRAGRRARRAGCRFPRRVRKTTARTTAISYRRFVITSEREDTIMMSGGSSVLDF